MAVKKVKDETKVTAEVVETTEVEVNEEQAVETTEVETTEVEVEVEETAKVEDEVEVDTEKAEVNSSNKPDGNVKIRMRVDHKCCIAMERYDLKEGKTYVVPQNVKRILNDSGLLAPL